jgi:hypothetical protein
MNRSYGLCLLGLTFVLFKSTSSAIAYTVGMNGDFPTISQAGPYLLPGDTALVLDGTYTDGTQFLYDLAGTEELPILILSETPLGAVFQGGTESLHLVRCSWVIIDGFLVEQQTGNGMNIDDGGIYDIPAHHITVRNCEFRDISAGGNNDLLKLSGLDYFAIENCQFKNGAAGSGIDMVGCHFGFIRDNYFQDTGNSGIQAKGGTQHIRIERNLFRDIAQRAINIGGSTNLEYFRPPLPDPIENAFEAANIEVYSNVFIGSWSPIAFVGCVNSSVRNNTFFHPQNWAIRILQETAVQGFLPCSNNEFSNNIVYLANDIVEVNIGPNTNAGSFVFSHNLWYNEAGGNWSPTLPVADPSQIIADPLFADIPAEDFRLQEGSPAIGSGIFSGEPLHDYLQLPFLNPPSVGAFEGDALAPCPGDFDGDGIIAQSDLLLLLTGLGCSENCEYDLDSNGMVNIADLLVFLPFFGSIC